MERRNFIKSMAAGAALSAIPLHRARGVMGLLGGSIAVGLANSNPVGVNLAAGGSSEFYYEDLPLFQDIIPWSQGFQQATAGSISSTYATLDANGWPTQDFGVTLHHSSLSPSWTSAAFYCGYTSNATGGETITGVNATISAIARSGTTVTFQLTPTSTTWGFTITGGSGATGVFAYANGYSASSSNGHIDITAANVTAGKPIFTTEALDIYKQFRYVRLMWAQNAWYRVGGQIIALSATAAAGASTATLATAITPGTYLMVFEPTTTQSTWDVRSVTVASGGTAISWTDGGLSFASNNIALQHSSSTRNTGTNTKAHKNWGQSFTSGTALDGYPLTWGIALSQATGKPVWSHIPVNDDGTYYQAHLQEIHDTAPAGVPQYIEIDNELWNGVGEVGAVLNGLAANAGLTTAQYLATKIHTIANYGRSLFGSDWNTRIRLVFAWQLGTSNFFAQALSYMVTQGWSPSADIWCLSVAPYFLGSPALTNADTTAQIITKVTTGSQFPIYVDKSSPTDNGELEKVLSLALAYGLPGGIECYEWGWDSVTEYSNTSNPNIGSAIMDSGMANAVYTGALTCLDLGIQGFADFEGGCSADTTAQSPRYEFSNNYAALISTGSPRLLGLQDAMNGAWTPSRNVVAAVGTTSIDARNYLDANTATASGYPNWQFQISVIIGRTDNAGWIVQVPTACTKTFKIYFTTTATASFNVYLDGTQVATAVSIPSGITNTAVTMATLTLSAGHHYIEVGDSASATGISALTLEFS